MPIDPREAGKGSGRRKEDTPKVEANYVQMDWNARERERLERERQAQEQEASTP